MPQEAHLAQARSRIQSHLKPFLKRKSDFSDDDEEEQPARTEARLEPPNPESHL